MSPVRAASVSPWPTRNMVTGVPSFEGYSTCRTSMVARSTPSGSAGSTSGRVVPSLTSSSQALAGESNAV